MVVASIAHVCASVCCVVAAVAGRMGREFTLVSSSVDVRPGTFMSGVSTGSSVSSFEAEVANAADAFRTTCDLDLHFAEPADPGLPTLEGPFHPNMRFRSSCDHLH